VAHRLRAGYANRLKLPRPGPWFRYGAEPQDFRRNRRQLQRRVMLPCHHWLLGLFLPVGVLHAHYL
jgi:hypothetical protein